MVSKVSCLLD
jgi:hypothetical protein